MLTVRVVPCLDVTAGRVVKGVKFAELRDAGDPVELARLYNREGADELVFYDITASHEERDIMVDVVDRVASEVFIPLTVGGGMRTVQDMHRMLLAGANKVSLNSGAIATPDIISQGADRFGSQCIVLSMDVKFNGSYYEVYSHGGRKPISWNAVEWAERGVALGAGEIVVNSIDADGTARGFELTITKQISELVSVPVVASGEVGTADHMADGALIGKADAVLAASIFHFGTLRIADVKQVMAARGVPVRPV